MNKSLKRKYEVAVFTLLKKRISSDFDSTLMAAVAFGSIGGGAECESFCDFVGPAQLGEDANKQAVWSELIDLAEEFKERDQR